MNARLSDYDYDLPRELIAQRPLERREDSRMMVLRRDAQTTEHRQFPELKTFLSIVFAQDAGNVLSNPPEKCASALAQRSATQFCASKKSCRMASGLYRWIKMSIFMRVARCRCRPTSGAKVTKRITGVTKPFSRGRLARWPRLQQAFTSLRKS